MSEDRFMKTANDVLTDLEADMWMGRKEDTEGNFYITLTQETPESGTIGFTVPMTDYPDGFEKLLTERFSAYQEATEELDTYTMTEETQRSVMKSLADNRAYQEGLYDPPEDEGFHCSHCGHVAPMCKMDLEDDSFEALCVECGEVIERV